jgi:hypothetical protein
MESTEKLFAHRVPEAAARQLAVVPAWLTECQLATLDDLRRRKRSSKAEIRRQIQICAKAVRHCHELGVSPSGLDGRACPRLADLLAVAAQGGIEHLTDTLLKSSRDHE